MRISKDRPKLSFSSEKFDCKDISIFFGSKKITRLTSGKACLYHVLKEWKATNKNIVVPYYICEDVIQIVRQQTKNLFFCDIDLTDLNISLSSLKKMSKEIKIDIVIVPSLYGNCADIINIERFCKENKIKLINDCAQCFGI